MAKSTIQLSTAEAQDLLKILKERFQKNPKRHEGISWEDVEKKLEKTSGSMEIISKMEKSGGEPDVVVLDPNSDQIIYCDCSAESPKERRSLCYDREALDKRKEHKPKNSAMDLANEIGIEILTEDEYHHLQKLGNFDLKTSSWLKTPEEIRKLGGSIFGDRRYNQTFIYHNGAESYYAGRGFRGKLIL